MKAPGSVEWRGGCWYARLRLPTGERKRVPMPGIGRDDGARAKSIAASMQASVLRGLELGTVGDYAARWLAYREGLAISSAGNNRMNLENHFLPEHRHLPITEVTESTLRAFVKHLDARVTAGEIAWKTARNIWGDIAKMFDDATHGRDDALRVLKVNPAENVKPPMKGLEREKQFLYPADFLALVSCPDVPLDRARLYTAAVYLYSRAGELFPLSWEDVDVKEGVAHIHQAEDRTRAPGVVKSTKSRVPRRFSIEPELLPMLRAMKAEGGRLLFPKAGRIDGEYGLAGVLRADLLRAGVTRAALHKSTATRKPIGFHDLRATGVTWMTVRGDATSLIMSRVGHTDYATTQRYIRQAEALRASFGVVFPKLPERLLGAGPRLDPRTHNPGVFSVNFVGAAGFEPAAAVSEVPVSARKVARGAAFMDPAATFRDESAGPTARLEAALGFDQGMEATMLALMLEGEDFDA
jgi:integrase